MSSMSNKPVLVDGEVVKCARCKQTIFEGEKYAPDIMIILPGQGLHPGTKQGLVSYYHEENPECFTAREKSR